MAQRTRVPAEALGRLVADSGEDAVNVAAVIIGTTHFTNAVVERRRLVPTAAIRLGLPATRGLPPMVDWPEPLRQALGPHVYLAHGGHEFDGRPISALDGDELRRIAADVGEKEIGSIAISSVFSPVNAAFEQEAARLMAEELPGAAISLSHEIGRVGLLERENATIMNACLRKLAADVVAALRTALERFGIAAPVHLSQNDGTLMSVEYAERYPVATFASGPTNSMRGAAFLSGLGDCAVVDIGGTTSDVGVLQHGFPREAAVAATSAESGRTSGCPTSSRSAYPLDRSGGLRAGPRTARRACRAPGGQGADRQQPRQPDRRGLAARDDRAGGRDRPRRQALRRERRGLRGDRLRRRARQSRDVRRGWPSRDCLRRVEGICDDRLADRLPGRQPGAAALVAKVQEPVISCATAVAQKAAEAALTGPQDCVSEMRDAYRQRRDAAVVALREHHIARQ